MCIPMIIFWYACDWMGRKVKGNFPHETEFEIRILNLLGLLGAYSFLLSVAFISQAETFLMQISFEYIQIWFNLQYFEGECFTPRQKSEIDGECVGSLFDTEWQWCHYLFSITTSLKSPDSWKVKEWMVRKAYKDQKRQKKSNGGSSQ